MMRFTERRVEDFGDVRMGFEVCGEKQSMEFILTVRRRPASLRVQSDTSPVITDCLEADDVKL